MLGNLLKSKEVDLDESHKTLQRASAPTTTEYRQELDQRPSLSIDVVRLKRHVVVYGARASSHSGDVSKAAPYFQPKGSRLCICFCMVSSPCLVLSLRHFGEVDFVHCPVSGVQSSFVTFS